VAQPVMARDAHGFVEQLERLLVLQGVALRPAKRTKREAEGFGVATLPRLADEAGCLCPESLRIVGRTPIRCPHAYQQVFIHIYHKEATPTVASQQTVVVAYRRGVHKCQALDGPTEGLTPIA
jgi:hypothetical protein